MTRIALLACALAATAAAQPAHLRVDAPAGAVLVDGVEVGGAGEWIAVPTGARAVALVDDPRAWAPRRADADVMLAAGDSLALALALPVRVRIESVPIRATIVRETASGPDTLGTAPVEIDLAPGDALDLTASLVGYETVRRSVTDTDRVALVLPLSAGTVPDAALLPTERSTTGQTLADVGLVAVALGAGTAAVLYKFRADRLDDEYRDPSSPDFASTDLEARIRSLDRASAVALGAMQVGLGVLAVRFVLR